MAVFLVVFLVISTIAGIMLGFRFKVIALVRAILLATAIITVSGIVSGHGPRMIAPTLFGAVALLQIGYFVGGILQIISHAHLPAWTTVRYRPPKVGIVPVDVELESAGAARLELLGSGIAAPHAVPPSIPPSAAEAMNEDVFCLRCVDSRCWLFSKLTSEFGPGLFAA